MRLVSASLALLVVAACASSSGSSGAPGSLSAALDGSARDNGVPRDLLVAIAKVEDGLTMPSTRDVDPAAQVPVAGPLELRRGKLDTLARGAALMGASELDLRRDTDLGLEAGARVLAELGKSTGARSSDLASWQAAIEELSGYADTAHRESYAHRVFAVLAGGGTFDGRDGERIFLAPHPELPPTLTIDISQSTHILGNAEYPGAEWFPTSCTNKCDTTRGGASVGYIVIHDTECGWDAAVATLQNDSGKSVQYIVGQDGKIGQFVPESYTAWHAGNYWYNQRSVGIEHVGYYHQTFPTAEYDASAKLVDYLTKKYEVPADRDHIIGHDQIPNGNVMSQSSPPCEDAPSKCETGSSYGGSGNHRDPGDWEWCTYMPRFGGSCKCDDVWSLWNCSSDLTQAFRCTNGNVEVEQCTAGCVVQPAGTDDVCNEAAVPPADDAGAEGDASPTRRPPPGRADMAAGGCNSSGGSPSSVGLLLVGAVALLKRRRR
jgi:uncharacterized protein (TIGR03382 family)